ncbi:MAG: hypothetical protein ACREHG_02675 [Candidatus Saccharimonadales bacterium]
MTKKTISILIVILGVLLLGLAAYYWITPAGNLPIFFPGYETGSPYIHFKHGLVAFILAILAFIVVWFSSKKKSTN